MKSLTIFATILSSAIAAPATAGTGFDATFDDRPGSAVTPELFPVGTYRGLSWPTFNFYADTLSAVKARSGNQLGASFFLQDPTSKPMITANYPDSKTKSLNLDSTYLGCVVTSQTGLLPQPCTLSFTGVEKGGAKTKPELCEYKGTLANPATVLCTFRQLNGVQSVEIDIVKSATLPATTVFLLDEVKGKTFSRTGLLFDRPEWHGLS